MSKGIYRDYRLFPSLNKNVPPDEEEEEEEVETLDIQRGVC